MKRLIPSGAVLLVSLVAVVAFPRTAASQDIFDRLGDHLTNRINQEISEQLDWQYVVPNHQHYHNAGTYYSRNGMHYYVPSAPPPGTYAGQPTGQFAGPIGPQSVKLEFGGFKQTSDLIDRLEFATNRLCLDMHYNYRHNAGFAQTYRESYQILQTTRDLDSGRPSRATIRQEVTELDEQFHHVQNDIKPWTRVEHRRVGEGGVNGKAEVVESVLHHLLFDIGVRPQHLPIEERAPPPADDLAPAPAAIR
jgi:hypothetical protein